MLKTTKFKIQKEMSMLAGAIAGVCLAYGINADSATFKMLTNPIKNVEKILEKVEVQA